MSEPRTTIAVVPRETFSMTPVMLKKLLAHTAPHRRVVVVEGGSPRRYRRRLEGLASAWDFTFVYRPVLLTANEARNLAMPHVRTEFVAFLDNDTLVDRGWLERLERCADETGASLVTPAVLWGGPGRWEIHHAGGPCHIVEEEGIRRFDEHNTHMHRSPDLLAELTRGPTESIETHCVLVRTEALRRIGPFDEGLVAGREHSTLALLAREAGGEIWLEPSVVVRYPWPKRNTIADYLFYLPRWSDEWGERSFRRFNETWRLTDTTIDDVFRRGHLQRRMGGGPPGGAGFVPRMGRMWYRARRILDRVVTPQMVRWTDRQRATSGPARVLHAASWESSVASDA
jgi:GT2 family glycosyltransferase